MSWHCFILYTEYGIRSTYMYISRGTYQWYCLFSLTECLPCGRKFMYNIFPSNRNPESWNYYFHFMDGKADEWIVCYLLHWFARAVITKCHRLGGLISRSSFSHSLVSWISKSKVWTGCLLLKPLSLACRCLSFCYVFPWPTHSVHILAVSSFSYRKTVMLD